MPDSHTLVCKSAASCQRPLPYAGTSLGHGELKNIRVGRTLQQIPTDPTQLAAYIFNLLVWSNCIPHCSEVLCKTGSQQACVTATAPMEICSSYRCAVSQLKCSATLSSGNTQSAATAIAQAATQGSSGATAIATALATASSQVCTFVQTDHLFSI